MRGTSVRVFVCACVCDSFLNASSLAADGDSGGIASKTDVKTSCTTHNVAFRHKGL